MGQNFPQRLREDLGYNLRAGYAVGDGGDIQALAQQIDAQGNSNTETKGVRYALPSERLSQDLGMDFTGFKHQVDADGIRHALKNHGDAKREAQRGQIAVTADDFGRIPEIVADYDSVELVGKDSNGNDLIRYRKAFNGTTYYVEEVRRKRGELTIKTLWKTPTRAQMLPQDSAPPAYAQSASVGISPPQGAESLSQPTVMQNRDRSRVSDEESQNGVDPTTRKTAATWAIREKTTGRAVMETSDQKKIQALNTEKYEAVPIGQHLNELSDPESAAGRSARGTNIGDAVAPAKVSAKRKAAKKDSPATNIGDAVAPARVPGGAVHADPGSKPEPATASVVADSAETAASHPKVTMKQARVVLLGKIDEAINTAPEEQQYDERGRPDMVVLDVPGDGKFRVLNTKARLTEFRKQVDKNFRDRHAPRGPQPARTHMTPEQRAKVLANAKKETAEIEAQEREAKAKAGPRPEQVDIEDAVKAQSAPRRSNRNESEGRHESGIQQGLRSSRTDQSEQLEQRINAELRRIGDDGAGSFRVETVSQDELRDSLRRALGAFRAATGTEVHIFRNLTPEVFDFNGVNFRDGVVHIAENTQYPVTLTAAHEWLHNLRKSNPDLYWELADEVARQGDLSGYQQRLKREGEARWRNMDLVEEELTAAAVSDALTDPAFLQRLAERNRGLFRRVAWAFLDFLNTLTSGWRDQGSNAYLRDVEAFRDKLAEVLDALPAQDAASGSADVEALYSHKGSEADPDRQFKDTERAYGGKAAYDKAKADGRTKLTYGQWVQVRTPAFKRWFGDWEAVQHREFLDGKPVTALTGDEFKPDGVPLTEKVPKWYAEQGVSTVAVAGIGEVALDAVAVKRSLGHGIGRDKATAFAAVPDVLRNGRIIHSEVMRGSIDGMVYHIAAPIEITGKAFVMDVLVKSDANTSRMYVHEVALKEMLQQSDFKVGAVAAKAGKRADADDAGAIRSVLQGIYAVNPVSVSKVIDPETGEPLVVYHGTAQSFDTFDNKKTGANDRGLWGRGHYFASSANTANSYAMRQGDGAQVISAFVALKNPLTLRTGADLVTRLPDGRSHRDLLGPGLDGSKIKELALGSNHDGVVQILPSGMIGDVVAYSPNQIKSATGNSGAFDAENPDIRFSRKAQTKAAYEARIDALFNGAKGNRQGVRILDRADMLDLLGHGDKPLHLVESAVGKKDSVGRVKHPGMTAEMWKKLPEWIENPVAAFESDTVDGRITLVAPELVDGKPALVVLEPNGSMAGMDVHVAVNAYEKDNAAGVPTARWVRDGKLLYLDQKRSPTLSERSGLQLPRDVRQLRGYKRRVQTETDLHKYRAEREEVMFSRREENIRKAKDKADAKREEVRQSLAVSAKAAGWNYDTSKWEGRRGQRNRLRAEMQDKMLAWRDVQNQIEEKLGEVIPDAANVYRLENLMHGRVGEGLDRLERNAFEPLIKAMHAAKVDTAALEEYLYALHARERNADIAAKNPKMPDGGSGMTNAEAEAILAKADHAKMAPLAQMVRRIIRQTRQRMLVHGLITQETFDALNAQYEWYVPLRGKPEKEPWIQRNKSGAGRGLDGRGKQVQEALGRGAGNLATDLLANVFRDAQMSVINAEKARVGRGLMRLVLMNPNPGLWQVEPVQTERVLNSEGEVVERVMNDFSDPSIIAVRHNGTLYRVQVNSAPLAEAMTHAGVEHLDKAFRMAGSINRYFSAVLTKYNPSFTLVNASRDMIFGLTGLAVEYGEKAALQAAMRYPQAAKAAWRQARGQFDAGNEWDVWAREFVEHGGKTGMIHVHDVEAISRDIGKGLLREASTARQVGRAAVEAIGHANDAVENALRLSAYVTLRQQGMSADKAAEYAKNLTVNFNRKGYLGSKMNAWLLFYNASIQGSHRTIKLMKRPKTWGYLGALALAQAVSALAMMGMEDEDGQTLWEKIPDHVKQRNLVIPTGGESFVTVPMPYGFNWFVYMSGQTLEAILQNPEKSAGERAKGLTEKAVPGLLQAFSPVPLNDGALGLLPTVLRIPANVQVNRNDFGNAIRRENPYSKSDIPRASMGHADTVEIFKVAAKGLNRLGGGTDYKAPAAPFDWAPEDLEYLLKTATGGMGKFVVDVAMLGGKVLDDSDDVEVTVRDVPIINRFVSQVDERAAQASLFYERRAAMDEYLREARGILKAEGVTVARRFIAARPELSGVEIKEQKGGAVFKARADSLYAAYKAVEAGSKARNERVNMAFANSPNWPIPTEASRERNRQVREADQVLTDKRQEFNRRWEAAVNDWARGD